VGVIIGAGIYVLIGPATQRAGALVWASMLLASALCALTAFSYMELTSMFPKAGSEHEFARQVFPNWISFTTGWGIGWVPVVPCLGIIATLALSRELEMQPSLAAFALLSAGLLLYFMNQSRK
jgi:amino acid transporter